MAAESSSLPSPPAEAAAPAAPAQTRSATDPGSASAVAPGTAPPTAPPTAAPETSSSASAGALGSTVPGVGSTAGTAPGAASEATGGSSEPAPAASSASAPEVGLSPAPTRHLMLTDELPYVPGHLHRHGRDASRESGGRESGKRPYHPAPGIVVDVVDAHGGATAAALQRAARNLGYWPFRQCYEAGLRHDQHLAGKVSLELAVSPSGVVDHSVVRSTTVRDEMVATCVAREGQHLALPPSESPTTAHIDVSLAVGDEPVPVGRPVPNAEPIRESLRGQWGAVRRCYASKLGSHPGIGGRMELHFHVRHGEIVQVDELTSAGEGGARFGDPDVTRCVLGVYRTARLPGPHGQREPSFVYPLHFESAQVESAAP
jgi:hypothetical protein